MSAVGIAINRLSGISDLVSLIGPDAFFADEAPQGQAPPYIVVGLTSEGDETLLAGPGGLNESRVTITCMALSALITHRMGEIIKKQFPCVKQTVAIDAESPGGVATDVDIAKDVIDLSDTSTERTDDSQSVFRRITDYSVCWR